ncbi:M protein [Helicobacter pylori]|uniref:M protein n=1 Tax=Helicobacter pylori TaxID=210 RepID=UPI0013E29AAC|nr:M protein [Helicobacter pylori]
MGRFFRKSSNDTQENSKDAQGREKALKKAQEENTELNRERNDLAREKDKLASQNTALTTEKDKLADKNKELDDQVGLLKEQIKSLEQSQQVLENEKADLKTEKDKLEQKYAPYKKLEKLYEVFLEVKGCLNFNFVEKTHSAMDLIAYILSDSKYYLESLYNKASQELSDKKSDKGEKLAELFDLLFEYVKDKKFERLKEPSAYDSTCKSLYPEQNISQKMQRVVLIGYTYNKKTPPYYTIVDMGS